jgi:hypothetical protein
LSFLSGGTDRGGGRLGKISVCGVGNVQKNFSIAILLKTLFSPWKRINTYSGKSLEEKERAFVDNLVSRGVGFFIRFFSLLAAFVMIIVVAVAAIFIAIVWPFIPIAIVYFAFRGVTG